MIPHEFFDWALAQWWGAPSFVIITLVAMALFSWGLAVATQ